MYTNKNRVIELAATVLLVAGVVLVYTHTAKLLQGTYIMSDWTNWVRWVTGATDQKVLQQYIPVELLGQLILAITIVYILGFKRRVVWQWLATHSMPSWLAQTSIARVVEGYLTDNYRVQRKALTHLPESVETVMDVGCGGAAYLTSLKGIRKVGLDVSPKRLRIAQHYCDVVIQGNLTERGVLNNLEADAVLCFEVIEHLTDEQGVQLLKDLEKFPTVILTTPREWFEVRRDGYERHLSFWPPEKLSQFGYELVDSGRIPPSNTYVRRQT